MVLIITLSEVQLIMNSWIRGDVFFLDFLVECAGQQKRSLLLLFLIMLRKFQMVNYESKGFFSIHFAFCLLVQSAVTQCMLWPAHRWSWRQQVSFLHLTPSIALSLTRSISLLLLSAHVTALPVRIRFPASHIHTFLVSYDFIAYLNIHKSTPGKLELCEYVRCVQSIFDKLHQLFLRKHFRF